MMKKFDCVKSFTAALVAALVLIVAGAFVLGFVGFNKDVKYTDHYEVKITAEESFGDNNKTMKDTAEAVFKEDGLRYVYREELDSGRTVLYLFRNDVPEESIADLQGRLDTAFANSTVDVTAEKYAAAGYGTLTEMWWALLAAGILLVAGFLYAAIRYKWAAAFAFLITSAIGAVLTVALTALTRAVVTPAFLSVTAGAFVLTMAFALYFANVVAEDKKSVASDGLPVKELVSGAFREVFFKTLVPVLGALVLVAAMAALAPVGIKFAAIQILIGVVCAACSALFLFGGLRALLAKK